MFQVIRPVVIAGALREIGTLVREAEVEIAKAGTEIRSALVRIVEPAAVREPVKPKPFSPKASEE